MTQRERILKMLEDAGDEGVTNLKLNTVAFRYGGRLHELREDGYRIRSKHVKGSVWKFTLLNVEPFQIQADMDEPEYMDFNERLMTNVSACCGEPINLFGFCGGCREHI